MKDSKRVLTIAYPEITTSHTEDDQGLEVTVELPGVGREDVDLTISKGGFCLSASRADLRYEGCYLFGHEVDSDEAKAKLDNGRLRLTVPFLEPTCVRKVAID